MSVGRRPTKGVSREQPFLVTKGFLRVKSSLNNTPFPPRRTLGLCPSRHPEVPGPFRSPAMGQGRGERPRHTRTEAERDVQTRGLGGWLPSVLEVGTRGGNRRPKGTVFGSGVEVYWGPEVPGGHLSPKRQGSKP